MHKTKIFVAALSAVLVFIFPSFVTQAGTVATTSSNNTSSTVAMADQVLYLRVTAYTSLPDETDSTPFITADGSYVHDGIVATNLLPFGTKVEIPSLFGDKIFTVDDRMNQNIKNGMDIWMSTKGKAIFFGVHYADIVIVGQNQNTALSLNK